MESSVIESDANNVKFWFSKRFYVAVLMFFGTINTFSLSANLNIAIVEMTSQKNVTINNETVTYGPEFDWDSRTKGLILSAFSYGISLSIFGGYLAMKFGGSRIIALGVATTAIITLLNPLIIQYNFYLFVLARAIEGIVEGFAIVSFAELWAQWAPVQDRSRLMSIGFSGMYAGTAIAYPVCGYIMHQYGWPAAFYLTGGVSLIWSVVWFLLVPSDPSCDKFISKKELRYIKNNQMQRERPKNIRSLFFNLIRSKCVMALCVAKFTYGVGFSIVVTCFPMYIKDLTNEEIHKVGIYSSLPNIISAFTVPVVGCMADYLHNKEILTITKIHKIFMCGGFVIGALLLFIIGSFSTSFAISMICFMLFKITLSTNYVISQLCCVSMAPKCSGVVFGFLTIFYTLSSVSSPLIIGLVVTDHSQAQWNTCFLMSAVLLLIGAFTYFFFGSSDPQPWSYSGVDDDRKSDMLDENKEF